LNLKLPRMRRQDIEEVLRDQMICRIAFKGDDHPYMAPFQYVFMDGTMYFHFTDYGKKMQLIEKDRRVAVEVERYKPDLSEYCFVVMRGSLEEVEDRDERAEAIRRMSEEAKARLSEKFLVAHGFRPEEGWSALSAKKPLKIVKLTDVAERIGLTSL
jgi:nitroimidazol reductase NimA-like FMN-containing flavoprotein (pyridoxamine 5'-phosphate oxidase superfamily)